MEGTVPRTWFLSFCSAVAAGLRQKSLACDDSCSLTDQKHELRIVLLGKTMAGKSATGNTILGEEVFKLLLLSPFDTQSCKRVSRVINGRKISVIDTPGLFDTEITKDVIEEEIKRCEWFSAPGPHAFLVVIKLERFTEEYAKVTEYIEQLFGEEALNHTMAVFTHGDQLEGQDITRFVQSNKALRTFVRSCGSRYFVIDNKKQDSVQVMQLLNNIDEMVCYNGGACYTNENFQKAEREIEKVKQRILKENEEERKREMEALVCQHMHLQHEELEKMKRQLAKEQEEQARTKAEDSNLSMSHLIKMCQEIIRLLLE
ncbi:GTPase IMAP family member 7 [Garra rufa]|uniref:GTPase IMAP family member 7 n=1 Tax=Garra rufa TaxID=137080 RepID=UPI003CCE863B